MIWLSLHFPTLALDIVRRGSCSTESLAILDTRETRHRILLCNQSAAASGVRAGMSLPAALALEPALILKPRQCRAERAALDGLATWAQAYTPKLSIAGNCELVLEVAGSLRLFGGLEALIQKITDGIGFMGYAVGYAAAPTPQAASLLVRAQGRHVITENDALLPTLKTLPFSVFEADGKTADILKSLGLKSIEDLLKLPRPEIRSRISPWLLDCLDRALGRKPDPRQPFEPAPRFRAHLELPSPTASSQALLFGAHRLLQDMDSALTARNEGVAAMRLLLHHPRGPASLVRLGLAQPSRNPGRWQRVLRSRLDQLTLDQEVLALTLRGGRQTPLTEQTDDLFDETPERLDNERLHLLERLQARLGEEAVKGIVLVRDHRPERAWRTALPGAASEPGHGRRRPLWLLREPRCLQRLQSRWRLNGPERIESGWWDGVDVSRDYFCAETESGERLWIFRDRRSRAWFLHGVFA
jgi:protein ImuB